MTDLYKFDEEFRLFCCQLDALALLPLDQVKEGMAYIRKYIHPGAEDLVVYFDNTYVFWPISKKRDDRKKNWFQIATDATSLSAKHVELF